jgi:hypothetical protein
VIHAFLGPKRLILIIISDYLELQACRHPPCIPSVSLRASFGNNLECVYYRSYFDEIPLPGGFPYLRIAPASISVTFLSSKVNAKPEDATHPSSLACIFPSSIDRSASCHRRWREGEGGERRERREEEVGSRLVGRGVSNRLGEAFLVSLGERLCLDQVRVEERKVPSPPLSLARVLVGLSFGLYRAHKRYKRTERGKGEGDL